MTWNKYLVPCKLCLDAYASFHQSGQGWQVCRFQSGNSLNFVNQKLYNSPIQLKTVVMSSPQVDYAAILLFQNLYIDHYPFSYKPSVQWVVTRQELRLKNVVQRRNRYQVIVQLVPVFVCYLSVVILADCIFLLSKIQNFIIWKDSRFWGWLVFTTVSILLGFIYNMLAIGEKGDSFLHICNQFVDLDRKIRTGKFSEKKILCLKWIRCYNCNAIYTFQIRNNSEFTPSLQWRVCNFFSFRFVWHQWQHTLVSQP